MPVPHSVKLILDKQHVAYSVSDTPECAPTDTVLHDHHLRNMGAARSIILQDNDGRLLALIAADTLLDLNRLNQITGRQLRATTDDDLQKFYSKHQLESIPALPNLAGLPTVIDKSLMDRHSLFLDAGTAEHVLELQQDGFKQMVAGAIIDTISQPLAELEVDTIEADESEITHAVENFTERRIKQRLEETLELPPLPETAQRIIKLRVDPNADISDLANIVETDPSLAAQVVSWAASPYYSAPGKIKSIHDAIVRVLGFDMVLNLALGLALGKTLGMPKDGPNGALPYWKKSVYMAATIEALVTAIPRDQRPAFGMAYLSGLLHDFGYLVLAEVFPPHFKTICRYTEANPHANHQAIERHLLNITRDQVASWLMHLWNMPEEVVIALRHQGNPNYNGEHASYAKLIFLAQRLLHQRGIGNGPKLEVPDHIFTSLGLEPEQAYAAIDNILESSDDLDAIAGQMAGG